MHIKEGTFTPAPQRSSKFAMASAQGLIESKLMLRHGEQLVLSIFIPAALLIASVYLPVFGDDYSLDTLVPMVFAVAATSSGFTGQAISLAFDRRYGALKRTGASGAPPWTIIVGKILGVVAMVCVQIAVLGAVAGFLGWRPSVVGAVLGACVLFLGVACFTSLGLLMGGSLSSEMVLAISNLMWVIMMGIVGWVVYSGDLSHAGWWNLVPTVSLAAGISDALALTANGPALLSLLAWLIVGVGSSVRFFRFDD